MGILDSIIGEGASGVKKQTAGGSETFLGQIASSNTAEAAAPTSMFLDRIGAIQGGRTDRRKRQIAGNVTSIAQRFGGSIRAAGQSQGGDGVGAALNRARGIFKIAGATARDFDSRLLGERIGARKHGLGVRTRGRGAVNTGLSITDSVAQAHRGAQKDLKSAQRGFVGGIAGMAAGAAFGEGGFAEDFGSNMKARITNRFAPPPARTVGLGFTQD